MYSNELMFLQEPIKSEIELIVKPFSGGVEIHGENNFVTDPGGHEYVGPPAPGIDQAWDLLLEGLYIGLKAENILAYGYLGLNLDFNQREIDLAGSTFQWPESGFYFSGLDVYHSLHCLVCPVILSSLLNVQLLTESYQNRLRQAIYPDYYTMVFGRPTDPSRDNHIGLFKRIL